MMCMGMSTTWMILSSLLMCFIVLGFGYIIWLKAAKQTGSTKLVGQIISIVIIVLAVVLCLYGGMKAGKMKQQMMDKDMMMKQEMMKQDVSGNMDKHEMKKMMMKKGWKK